MFERIGLDSVPMASQRAPSTAQIWKESAAYLDKNLSILRVHAEQYIRGAGSYGGAEIRYIPCTHVKVTGRRERNM